MEYSVTNVGRTPALLDELWAAFHYADTPPAPPRSYRFPKEPILRDTPFGSGKIIKEEFPIAIRGLDFLSYPPLAPNIEPDKALYFIMLARYSDVSGQRHETGICRVYTIRAVDTFARYGGEEYNYQS